MLQPILTSVSSLSLAERLRIPVVRNEDTFLIDCQTCGQPMWLNEHGFLCSNQSCSFFAGNVVDFMRSRTDSYEAAVRELMSIFQDRSSWWTALPEEEAIPSAAWLCQSKRALFEFFRSRFINAGLPSTPAVSGARSWLAKLGLHPEAFSSVLFPMSAEEQTHLLRLCGRVPGASVPEPIQSTVIAAPFYSSHHNVTSVSLYEIHRQETREAVVESTRFSYAGLPLLSPRCKHVHLTGPRYFEVCQGNTHFYHHDTSRVVLGVRLDTAEDTVGFVPEEAVFHSPNGINLTLAEQLMSSSCKLRFANCPAKRYDGVDRGWEDYLFESLKLMSDNEGRLSTAAKTLMGSLRLNNHIRQRLIKMCYQHGMIDTADGLNRIFRSTVVYQNDKLKLFSTPDGYQTVRTKGGARDALSNFVIDLHHNVLFKETGSLYHSGNVTFDGEQYPVTLSSRDLDSPSSVEEFCQRVVIQADRTTDSIPIIRDRLLFKHVSAHLRDVSMKLPQQEGINLLGWASHRRTFYAPSWKTTMEGTSEAAFCFHPDVPSLSNFRQNVKTVALLEGDMPAKSVLKDLIAMMVACVARSYLNYPIKGVMIRQEAGSQFMLETLFAQLGQTSGLRRAGHEAAGISGFPVFGYGYNQMQLIKMEMPVFSLSSQGLPMTEPVTEQEAVMAGAFARKAIIQTCEWLMATGGEGYTRSPHVLHASELMEEGKWLFEKALSQSWEISSIPYHNIERVLKSVPYSRLNEHWRYDGPNQKVILFLDGLEVDRPFLETELRTLSDSLTVHENYFRIDAFSMLALLAHYYGQHVTLSQISDKDYQAAQVKR